MAFGVLPQDTAEFLLGSVVVTPIFFESDGTLDTSTEDWTPQHIQETLDKITESTDWWVETLAKLNTVHELNFVIDTTFANNPFETVYEPIGRRSNDYSLYVTEFLQAQGATTTSIETEMFKFNDAQRKKFGTDWSLTMIVVNSENQGDGQFAAGGSFSRAFAFAGGLFMVVPSTRPASTFAHEAGHIFWARDEYAGAGSSGTYSGRRGYYNTRNENAIDLNPNPNFVQQPSIMSAGDSLDIAWRNNVSPASTLAQIGWQDSDGDGIFDVLDVPLELTGSGYFDVATGKYRFKGNAKVQTLPNLNSSGYRSDITTNKISEVEYRFDNGPWLSHSSPGTYEAILDMEITVPSGATEIYVRTRDTASTVTSNVFRGRLSQADATVGAGINGSIWLDSNKNNLRDVGEYGQQGWTVTLLSNAGQPLDLRKQIEPNTMADGPVGTSAINGAVLGAIGSLSDGRAGIIVDPDLASNKLFSGYSISTQSFVSTWTSSRQFQATFTSETTTVSIDAIGVSNSYGRLEAYNNLGQLVGRYTTKLLTAGQTETMTISRATNDISYVIASGTARTSVKLDNLRHGAETTAQTNAQGNYYFPAVPAGTFEVQVSPQPGWTALNPASGKLPATVTANTATSDVDFGFVQPVGSPWQNPTNPLDVDNNGRLTASDALLVISQLNKTRSGPLTGSSIPTFPYIDANGDRRLSASDALVVIAGLNSRRGGSGGTGEGEGDQLKVDVCFPASGSMSPLVGEGEGGDKDRFAADDELLLLLSLDRLQNTTRDA